MYYQENRYYNTSKVSDGLGKWDSKFEAVYAQELELRKKAGDIKSWEAHQKIELYVGDYWVCDYLIDFVITHNDESLEYVECKGWPTPYWRIKWKLFEALYSDKGKITLIQQGKKKITFKRKRKNTCG